MDKVVWSPLDGAAVRHLIEDYWRAMRDGVWRLYLERLERYPPPAVKMALKELRESQEVAQLPGIPLICARVGDVMRRYYPRQAVEGPPVDVVREEEIAADDAFWWRFLHHPDPKLRERYTRIRKRMAGGQWPFEGLREPGEEP